MQPHPTVTATEGHGVAVGDAHRIAVEVLTWDTTAGTPADHVNELVRQADPSGVETPGLVADLANYLPTEEEWTRLRRHAVTQSATIHTAAVPDGWDRIVADAGLPEGTTAVTIRATRHRHGTSGGQPSNSDHPITFTLFLHCPAGDGPCHLLRLSLPDTPLQ